MDIEMPVMDGPTALMELRNSGNKIPVIALTAHAMPEHRQEYLRLGFNGYISKPVDQQELIDLICNKTNLLMKT
jgi:CheY-like chemotaxis protein